MKVRLLLPLIDDGRRRSADLVRHPRPRHQAETGGIDSLWIYDHRVKVEPKAAWGTPAASAGLVAEQSVIVDALAAYAALGVAHVQLDVQPATPATFATVLDGLARARGGA